MLVKQFSPKKVISPNWLLHSGLAYPEQCETQRVVRLAPAIYTPSERSETTGTRVQSRTSRCRPTAGVNLMRLSLPHRRCDFPVRC